MGRRRTGTAWEKPKGSGAWLAAITLEAGEQTDGRQTYRSPLRVRELTSVPSVVDVAVP